MQELFRWALLTGFVISVVTFVLNFVTPSLGIRLLVAFVLMVAAIIYYTREHGVPESAFLAGGVIGLAAMTGLLVVMTTDILEYVVTLVLFAVAFLLGAFVGTYSLKKHH